MTLAGPEPSPLLRAMTARDGDAIDALMSEEVVFHSPVRSYRGRHDVVHLLAIVGGIVGEPMATRQLRDERERVTFITGHTGEKETDGMLSEVTGPDGLIVEVTLMLRPLDSLLDGVQMMGNELDASPLPSRAGR